MSEIRSEALAREVVAAREAGDTHAVVAALEQLESLEPERAEWPRQRARALARLGDRAGERGALERSAELDVRAGRPLPAWIDCRWLRSMDPGPHPVHGDLLRLARRPGRGQAASSPSFEPASLEAGLDHLVLSRAIANARPCPHWEDGDRAREIPIEGARRAPSDPGAPEPARDRTPLLDDLDGADLEALIAAAGVVEITADERLHRQDDPDPALYVVADGALARWREVAAGPGEPPVDEPRPDLGPGDVFGHGGLIGRGRVADSVHTRSDVRLIRVDRPAMWRWLAGSADRLCSLLRWLRQGAIDELAATGALEPWLGDVSPEDRAGGFSLVEVDDGCAVLDDARHPRGPIVVLAGRLQLVRRDDEGDKVLRDLDAGALCSPHTIPPEEAGACGVVSAGRAWLLDWVGANPPPTAAGVPGVPRP